MCFIKVYVPSLPFYDEVKNKGYRYFYKGKGGKGVFFKCTFEVGNR